MRHEFSASVKKAARIAAGGICQAAGTLYGLPPETRCTVILVAGNHDYDHYPVPAHVEGSNTVENCMVLCKAHHAYKTAHFDIPAEAKIKRILKRDGKLPETRKHRPKKIQSRGFQKGKRPIQNRQFQRKKSDG